MYWSFDVEVQSGEIRDHAHVLAVGFWDEKCWAAPFSWCCDSDYDAFLNQVLHCFLRWGLESFRDRSCCAGPDRFDVGVFQVDLHGRDRHWAGVQFVTDCLFEFLLNDFQEVCGCRVLFY